jgi:hypothetical protein
MRSRPSFETTVLEHRWSYHVRQHCQDLFQHQGKRQTFFFKDRVLQFPARPQHPYEPKKKNNQKNKNKKPQ